MSQRTTNTSGDTSRHWLRNIEERLEKSDMTLTDGLIIALLVADVCAWIHAVRMNRVVSAKAARVWEKAINGQRNMS